MNPVPLFDAYCVRAYACGRCGTVHDAHWSKMVVHDEDVPDHIARQAESARACAERCCRCSECKTPLDGGRLFGECPPCAEKERARLAALNRVHERQDNERDALLLARALDVDAARRLETLMSDISENATCAAWEGGLEFTLWTYVLNGPDPKPETEGNGWDTAVREAEVAEMRRLSEKAGGWWVWGQGGHLFVTLDEWRQRYAAHVG